jgi:hypothetical protein
VVLDDVGLVVRRERPVHHLAAEAGGVVGHGDALVAQRVRDHQPGPGAGH